MIDNFILKYFQLFFSDFNVTFEWGYSGFTAITSLIANVEISGVHPIERKSWDQTFVGSFDTDSWTGSILILQNIFY